MKFLHHSLPNLGTLYFSFSSFLKVEFDAVNNLLDQIDTDGPFLAGFFQAIENFKTVENFSPSVFLHDRWKGILCPLAGGKSFMTAEAFPPPPNGILILSQTGIDYLTLGMITERTFHRASPLSKILSVRFETTKNPPHNFCL
jgi:hypothetical protein